jgi:hypothetical protein
MSLFAGDGFLQTLLSRNKQYYKDYSVPTDFPYVIHSDGVPPILFFDAEHIDLDIESQSKSMKSVLSFAAFGVQEKSKEPRCFIHMFVDHIRDESYDLYAHPNFIQLHMAYMSILRKKATTDESKCALALPKPEEISGHVTVKRLRQTLEIFFKHVKVWIGWGIGNDRRALETILGYNFEKRFNVKFIDLQTLLYDCLGDDGSQYNKQGMRHVLSLADAVNRFLHDCKIKLYQKHQHSACADSQTLLQVFDVVIEKPELQWLKKFIALNILK